MMKKYTNKLGSLHLTFGVLIALAAASIIGTLIEQGQPPAFYEQHYGAVLGRVILLFQADNFYQGLLYNGILVLLGVNLTVCTLNSISRRIWKDRRKCALFMLHCSILVIFTGALVSRVGKWSQYRTLVPGDRVALPGTDADIIFNDFSVDYYPGSEQVQDYRSTFTLREKDRADRQQVIRVNHPLHYRGFALYQSSFQTMADVDIVIRHRGMTIWEGVWHQGDVLTLPGRKDISLELSYFVPDVEVSEKGEIQSRSLRVKNPALLISIYKQNDLIQQQWVFQDPDLSERFVPVPKLFDYEIKQVKPFYATIIQVIKDPGLPFVGGGFALLFAGLALFMLNRSFNIKSAGER